MKKLNLKRYKVNYRKKKTILSYVLTSFILIALGSLYYSVPNVLYQMLSILNPDYEIIELPFYPYVILSFILALYWFYIYYNSKYSFSEVKRTKAKLFHVIKSSDFYKTEKVDSSKKVYCSLELVFYKTNNSLFIEAYTQGASFTKKSTDMGKEFESALNLPLIEKDTSNPSFTKYEFATKEIERLKFLSPKDILLEEDIIRLDGEKIWRPFKAPHILISGVTGGGKSYQIFVILLQLAKQGWELYLADPKQNDLASLRFSIPNSEKHVASTPTQIAKMTREVVEIMHARNEKYFNNENSVMGKDYRYYKLRPILLAFDEVAAFQEMDKKIGAEVMGYLKQIIMMGRQAGVFLSLSTQRPDHSAFDTAIRDQFGLRIALGKMSMQGLKMTLGEFEELPSSLSGVGQGNGYIVIDGEGWSNPRSYQSAFLDIDSIRYQETLKRFLEDAKSMYKDE